MLVVELNWLYTGVQKVERVSVIVFLKSVKSLQGRSASS